MLIDKYVINITKLKNQHSISYIQHIIHIRKGHILHNFPRCIKLPRLFQSIIYALYTQPINISHSGAVAQMCGYFSPVDEKQLKKCSRHTIKTANMGD